ncbi:MAG: hypothetical protein IKS65_09480 [Bacteroidales bacterium]|nr:hypothetical protein [Bacteroidales bacterium]
MKKIPFILILLVALALLPVQALAQNNVSEPVIADSLKTRDKNIILDAVYVTAERITKISDNDYVMIDFEVADDECFILQREKKSLKKHRVLVTNMFFEPVDTIRLPERLRPTNLLYDIAGNCQIVTQDSVYQIVKKNFKYFYSFPSDRKHFNEVMSNILFMTDRFVYFCEIKMDGYLMYYYRIDPLKKTSEILFRASDMQKYSEIPQEVTWHENHSRRMGGLWFGPSPEDWEVFLRKVWMRPEQSYLGHSFDTLFYFDHQNRKIMTFDENLNLLHSCDITYPEKKIFWRHIIYQDRAWGTFYTIFGTTLNEIDIKTGKTIPKINANNYLSQKMIIYKGNLYSLKKRRDSGNSELSFIEKTQLY